MKIAYNSILVSYKNIIIDLKKTKSELEKIYASDKIIIEKSSILWKIPVCYDPIFGLDLDAISQSKQLDKQRIIALHSEVIYTIHFIGFLPGFLYLGGLDQSLHIPRKHTPPLKIPKGSVGIGGKQTGIYPNESPGGWYIIGNSPINFFDAEKSIPCFAKAGDKIKFFPISLEEHLHIKISVEAGVYKMESEVFND